MTNEDCAKLLLESSFKEANLFWVRNSAIAVIQTLLFGFYVTLISEESPGISDMMNTLICTLGIVLSFVHIIILILSQHYNMTWFGTYKQFVEEKLAESSESNYKYLYHAVDNLSLKRFSILNTTTIFMLIPVALALFWMFRLL